MASRAFGYLYVTAYEAVAGRDGGLVSLAGQLNGLEPVPARVVEAEYDEAVVLAAALSPALDELFANTGPTGQRALANMAERLDGAVTEGAAPEVVSRSRALGQALAEHVLAWAEADGGQVIENMGFPLELQLAQGPGAWVPTSRIVQQQLPLLPEWGENRPFAILDGTACPVPAPPAYSEEDGSDFVAEAIEVLEVRRNLSDEQRAVARF